MSVLHGVWPGVFRLIGWLSVAALLVACQTSGPPALALEKAKQVTATFGGQGFVPPPKTITDITAILNEQKRADPEAAAKAQAAATEEPPAGLTGLDLAKFYWERSLAASRIDSYRQQIADLREAESLSRNGGYSSKKGKKLRHIILWGLSVALVLAGNREEAISYRKKALANAPNHGYVITRKPFLASLYASSGDLDAADQVLAEAEKNLEKARTLQIHWPKWGRMWTINFNRAKAYILNLKGRYAEAEPVFRALLAATTMESLESSRNYRHKTLFIETARIMLTSNLRHQGRLVEAEVEARKALINMLRQFGRYSTKTARVLTEFTKTIAEQGRPAEAEQLARAAINIYQQTGAAEDSLSLAFARYLLADSLAMQDRFVEALVQFDTIKNGLATSPEIFQRLFATNLSWAAALLGTQRNKEAHTIAKAAVERSRQTMGEKHYATAEARGVLAMALARLNKREAALAEFANAVPILFSRSRQSLDETTTWTAREHRLKLILESYMGVLVGIHGSNLEREIGIDALAEAFRIADAVRGRSVQRALAASGARAASRDPQLADLARREQDAQKQIAALYGLLANVLSVPTDQQVAGAIESLRTKIDRLRDARSTLMEEIESRFPDYAELISPKPATIEQARSILRPGEALIATYAGKDKTFVWAVPKEGEFAFVATDLGKEDLADTVAMLRSSLEPNAETLGDIPDFDVATAHGLYKQLLEPVKAGWKNASSILVIAHGPLGYLPLSVLPTIPVTLTPTDEEEALFSNHREVDWLARTHAVTVLPSVAALKVLRDLPPGTQGRKPFAGFGDPYFSTKQAEEAKAQADKPVHVTELAIRGLKTRVFPVRLRATPNTEDLDSAGLAQLPRLPDTADEIRSIAVALNADLTKDVFLGEKANEGAVKAMNLSGYKVISFATHGLVPGDLNGLTQPALALSAPDVANDTNNDGLLTMGEILGLKLDADWVVLSACNTGSGAGTGAEAMSGLGRAFFYAGTRALLVSNWPVETTSAKALTTDLFKRQSENPGLARAEALRRSMIALIDGPGYLDPEANKTVFSYAHPIFWAPFSLIGDGGGGRPAS